MDCPGNLNAVAVVLLVHPMARDNRASRGRDCSSVACLLVQRHPMTTVVVPLRLLVPVTVAGSWVSVVCYYYYYPTITYPCPYLNYSAWTMIHHLVVHPVPLVRLPELLLVPGPPSLCSPPPAFVLLTDLLNTRAPSAFPDVLPVVHRVDFPGAFHYQGLVVQVASYTPLLQHSPHTDGTGMES